MSSIVVSGDTSGAITIASPAVAGTNTLTLPAATGTFVVAGQNSAITAATAQASTSGVAITFTGIPSWVKRITMMFNGVSTNGTSIPLIQIGAGSLDTASYNASSALVSTANNTTRGVSTTTGFSIYGAAATASALTYSGAVTLSLFGSNTWVVSGCVSSPNDVSTTYTSGSKALSGTLDRIALITGNGTDTFDAGSINILYE